MILIRRDKSFTSDPENPNDLSRTEFGFENIEDGEMSQVQVDFKDFGRGPERRPDFAVKVEWIDVRSLLAAFIEMEHPEALYLQSLINLAAAIEGVGWTPDCAPTKELLEDLPPQSN